MNPHEVERVPTLLEDRGKKGACVFFRGQFYHTIDPKGRLSIPAKFREALANGHGEKLVIVPNGKSLEVHPLKEWQALEARVNALPKFDADARAAKYFYFSRAQDVTLDPQGRIQISPDYRERAGLLKDVIVIGMSEHFEVWDTERWVAYEREHGVEPLVVHEKLAAKGI